VLQQAWPFNNFLKVPGRYLHKRRNQRVEGLERTFLKATA
jgi:hypothetical protein